MLNGEYLNPYYFVDTGYDGSTAGAIPGTPGGVSRLPVAEGLLIHVVAVRLLTRGQRTGNDRGQRCYRQRGLQDIPMFFASGMTSCTAMLSGFQSSYISASYMAAVIAGFHNDLPRKLILLPEQPRNLRLNLFDGRVVSAGDAGSYGLCVVIEDEKGYQRPKRRDSRGTSVLLPAWRRRFRP